MKPGPSIYYASDKNIFDAINQSKVDADTLQGMFRRRNIVCSKRTSRLELAKFFSRLTHDYLDHNDLSTRLGVVSRRERVTAVDLKGSLDSTIVTNAIQALREKLGLEGDVANISNDSKSITLSVKYTVVDYKRSEFSQVQHRDGEIELIREKDGYVVRSTQSDYMDGIRDALISTLQEASAAPLVRSEVSLFHHKSHTVRSQFFFDLITELSGYVRRDVTDVFVYKDRPAAQDEEEDDAPPESHVERILLRGNGVSQSELLSQLTKEKSYYIAKVGWVATETLGKGYGFDIEAMFADPKECTGFSYILRGVYELSDNGKLSKTRRPPTTSEIDAVARAIESKARELMKRLDEKTTSMTATEEVVV